jgi:hypothetical protein
MAALANMNLIGVPHAVELISGIGVGFNCFTGQQMTSALAANPTVTQLGLDSQSFFKICYSAEDFNNTITHSLGVSAQINLKKASSSPDSISDSEESRRNVRKGMGMLDSFGVFARNNNQNK